MQAQLATEAMGRQKEMLSSQDGPLADTRGGDMGRATGAGGLDDTFGSDLELMEDVLRGDDDKSRNATSRGGGSDSGQLGSSSTGKHRRGRSSGMYDNEGGGAEANGHDSLEDDIMQEVAEDNLRVGTVGVPRGGSMLEELP